MLPIKSVIVRGVSDAFAEEAQRFDMSNVVSLKNARSQHDKYADFFRSLGLNVIKVDQDPTLPDCVFVEDPLIVIGKKALLTSLGHESRVPERKAMKAAVEKISQLEVVLMEDIDPKATFDGGDCFYTGREILAGRSSRTNDAGIKVVAQVFDWLKVTTIDVGDTLHLKSGIAMAGPTTIISSVGDENAAAIMKQLKTKVTEKYDFLEVSGKSYGGNCIYIETSKGSVLLHPPASVFPETAKVYDSIKADIKVALDISEFYKVDGCLSCMSVLLTV